MIWIKELEHFFFKKFNKSFTKGNDFREIKENNYQFFLNRDNVVEETPVALVYNGISHAVMMCSPHNLADFALGFSLTEGIIQHPQEIYAVDIEKSPQGIEIHIDLASRCFMNLKMHRRNLTGQTGCGICGREQISHLFKPLPPLSKQWQFNLLKLDQCLEQFVTHQTLRKQTGASHACAFFTPTGELLAIREDVGRHIALDKLLGWHAKAGKPQGFVLVSSRASYEMVQKTAICGIEMLIAMSASTSLAIQLANQINLTLIGFARLGRANVYTAPERLIFN